MVNGKQPLTDREWLIQIDGKIDSLHYEMTLLSMRMDKTESSCDKRFCHIEEEVESNTSYRNKMNGVLVGLSVLITAIGGGLVDLYLTIKNR